MHLLNDQVAPGSITEPLQALSETRIFSVPFSVLVETVSYVERRTMFFFKSSTEIFASVFSTSAIILYSLAPLANTPLN